MLKRSLRITKKGDFDAVYRFGKRFSFGMLSVGVKENNLNLNRFGVVAGIKFSKSAAKRNRIKRQIREIIRKNMKDMRFGHDIVISVKNTGKKADFGSDEIGNALENIFKKSNLLRK